MAHTCCDLEASLLVCVCFSHAYTHSPPFLAHNDAEVTLRVCRCIILFFCLLLYPPHFFPLPLLVVSWINYSCLEFNSWCSSAAGQLQARIGDLYPGPYAVCLWGGSFCLSGLEVHWVRLSQLWRVLLNGTRSKLLMTSVSRRDCACYTYMEAFHYLSS